MWKSYVDPVAPSVRLRARVFLLWYGTTRVSTPPEDREQTDKQAGEDRARDTAKIDET